MSCSRVKTQPKLSTLGLYFKILLQGKFSWAFFSPPVLPHSQTTHERLHVLWSYIRLLSTFSLQPCQMHTNVSTLYVLEVALNSCCRKMLWVIAEKLTVTAPGVHTGCEGVTSYHKSKMKMWGVGGERGRGGRVLHTYKTAVVEDSQMNVWLGICCEFF